jgi:hypothetical protein
VFADGSHFVHEIEARATVWNEAGARGPAVAFGSAIGDELSFVAEQEGLSETFGTGEEVAIAAAEEFFDEFVLEDELRKIISVDLARVGGPDLPLCRGVREWAGGSGCGGMKSGGVAVVIGGETCELESLQDFGEGGFLIDAVEVKECSGSEERAPGGLAAFEVFRGDIEEEGQEGAASFRGGLELEGEFFGDQSGGGNEEDDSSGTLDGVGGLSEEGDAG